MSQFNGNGFGKGYPIQTQADKPLNTPIAPQKSMGIVQPELNIRPRFRTQAVTVAVNTGAWTTIESPGTGFQIVVGNTTNTFIVDVGFDGELDAGSVLRLAREQRDVFPPYAIYNDGTFPSALEADVIGGTGYAIKYLSRNGGVRVYGCPHKSISFRYALGSITGSMSFTLTQWMDPIVRPFQIDYN